MQAAFGPVFCSGPTNVSVNNFLERVDARTAAISARLNKDKAADDRARYRRKLVVRGFSERNEEEALMCLLQHPEVGDDASPICVFGRRTNWRLCCSLAF